MTRTSISTTGTTTSLPATMRAVVADRYGSADVLRVARTALPEVSGTEVLLRVAAAGLDRGVWHLMTGRPYLLRLGFGLRRPRTRVPGTDVAGTVVAVGPAVRRFAVGDEVLGVARGSFAEYAAAQEDRLVRRPEGLTVEQAAVLPTSGVTALQAVCDVGGVRPGQRVLVTGASGGVGSHAVQLAKACGAEVTAQCGTAKLDLVRSLGADRVIDHTRGDLAEDGQRFDLVVDIAGNPSLSRLRRALTPTGTAVIVGGEQGGRWTGGIDRPLRAVALSPFLRQRLTMVVGTQRASHLERLTAYVEAGQLTPSVDRSYPLAEIQDAMRRLVSGQVRGKVAITG